MTNVLNRRIGALGLAAALAWGGLASASTGNAPEQGQNQVEQGNIQEQTAQQDCHPRARRIALVLAYLKHKSDSNVTIRDLVKAKFVSKRAQKLVKLMQERFEENDRDVDALAKLMKIRLVKWVASDADEQDEEIAQSSFIEKLKAAAADRVGEDEFMRGTVAWTARILARIERLQDREIGPLGLVVLKKAKDRVASLKAAAEEETESWL